MSILLASANIACQPFNFFAKRISPTPEGTKPKCMALPSGWATNKINTDISSCLWMQRLVKVVRVHFWNHFGTQQIQDRCKIGKTFGTLSSRHPSLFLQQLQILCQLPLNSTFFSGAVFGLRLGRCTGVLLCRSAIAYHLFSHSQICRGAHRPSCNGWNQRIWLL